MNRWFSPFCLALVVAFALGADNTFGQDSQNSKEWPIGDQTQHVLKTSDGAEISYLMGTPEKAQAEKLPLMLFLHGRGESDGPLSLVAKWGPPMMVARGEKMPFLLVSPQCPREDFWSSETQQKRLTELLDDIVANHDVDTDRIYLTGLSMGGYGSWALSARHPDRFAAVVPVCGGGDPEHAGLLKDIPIWVFHGDLDKAVPFQRSVEMVDAIRAAGGEKIRFTSMEHFGHNSWSATYATPELYQWLGRQRLSDR